MIRLEETFERALKPKEVAERLGIAESTVRRWAILLEKAGYKFVTEKRGEIQARMFLERDVQVLACLKALSNDRSLSKEKAVEMTLQRVKSLFDSPRTDGDLSKADSDLSESAGDLGETDSDSSKSVSVREQSLADFEEYIGGIIEQRLSLQIEYHNRQSRELIEVLEARLEEQQRFIHNLLSLQDRALTETVRGLLEAASTKEKKPWWKFWA